MSTRSCWNKPGIFPLAAAAALWLLAGPAPLSAKVFKWTDETGEVHFTDSLSKIPKKYREKGKGFETLKEGPADPSQPIKLKLPESESRTVTVPLKQVASGNYLVDVLINGSEKASLMLDTGASMIVLGEDFRERLGVGDAGNDPKLQFSTAGGSQESPLIVLKKVQVGTASAGNVEATINPHMPKGGGLLGMSFLNGFKMEIDRAHSQLILKPLGGEGETTWAGKNEAWWRGKFEEYSLNAAKAGALAKRNQGDTAKSDNFQKLADHYIRLYRELDDQANDAGFPQSLRVPLQ